MFRNVDAHPRQHSDIPAGDCDGYNLRLIGRDWFTRGDRAGMVSRLPVLHGGGLPHADSLGVPVWLQWLVVVLALAIAGWLVLDARGQRRSQPVSTPVEAEPAKGPAGRERLVRVSAPPRPKPVVVPKPVATTRLLS